MEKKGGYEKHGKEYIPLQAGNKTANRNYNQTNKNDADKEPEKTVRIQVKTHRDSNGGHPHGIFDTIDNRHISVGFTTSNKKGKNHGNIPLDKNPLEETSKEKNKKSYMRRQGTVDKVCNYTNPQEGEMTEKDYKKAKGIAQKAKVKYLQDKEARQNQATKPKSE